MKYFFIYSAGGGAGDWNGVKRIWKDYMPWNLKSNLLLKFGDVFFNHATPNSPCRLRRWKNIDNLRQWICEATGDDSVTDSNILLDSGSAKLVNYIAHNNPDISNQNLIERFAEVMTEYRIIEKYCLVIESSNINGAVTFDIPNPFKIRSQNGNARLNILSAEDKKRLIELSAEFANQTYHTLNNNDERLFTIINGEWNSDDIALYLSKLDYAPKKFAVGGLSAADEALFKKCVTTLESANLNYEYIHFLGCGGIKKVLSLRNSRFNNAHVSVDCSTPINRSIDGNVSGTTLSCYFSYQSQELIRISPQTRAGILNLHQSAENPLFNLAEMTDIIDTVLKHQNNMPCKETYNGRAKLLIHNSDVFKRFANG